MLIRLGLFSLAIVLLLPISATADAGKNQMRNFQSGVNAGIQSTSFSYSIGPQLGWTPRIGVSPRLGFRGHLAATVFNKASDPDSKFLAPEAQLLASMKLGSFFFEAGGGVQTWLSQDVTSFMYTIQISIPFFIGERIYLGFSNLLASEAKTAEIKLGLGFNL